MEISMLSRNFKNLLSNKECAETTLSNPAFRVELREFPSTRYQGSKRKITSWLSDCLRELDFSSALDVFGGTGSVSFLLKKMGKEVTYNDILQFNHEIGLALIENDNVILEQKDIDQAQLTVPKAEHHFVRDTFSGVYFTDEENEWIDNIISNINRLEFEPRKMIYKRALLHYGLFQSCLIKRPFNLFHRRNLYLRFARVNREFGNKTSWDKPFNEHFAGFCDEANKLVFRGQKHCRAVRYDALELPDDSYDLVYIDPPYLKKEGANESSDYLKCYHFLEGVCNYDSWSNLIDYDSPNLRMKQSCSNKWINREQNIKAFDALFEKFAKSIIVVSYKKFGIPCIETLIRMLKGHGKKVRTHSRHYKYALNHQNGEAKLNREVVLIAE
jgi:adenine-specific DNA methylase